MYVFNYHPDTGAYLGGSPAEYDQLEPGRVLVPAWSTSKPPPRGYDSTKQWPHFVPAADKWELRMVPQPPEEPEPPAPVEAIESDPIDAMKATLQAHLDAAQRMAEQIKKAGGLEVNA